MSEDNLRVKIFVWLNEKSLINRSIFTRGELLKGYNDEGNKITLVGPTGIWTPKGFKTPISITTTSNTLYSDEFTEEGFLKYSYRGNNPNQRDNIGLRLACETQTPLIYFHSIKPGKYFAIFPVFIVQDYPDLLSVKVNVDPKFITENKTYSQEENELIKSLQTDILTRKYISIFTKRRLHQSAFRELVIDAYERQCTLCRLKHDELLDAAHIIPDSELKGEPIISNGLSMCKIHHTAFDKKIIGISPEYNIKVREDILNEEDGPMLKFGLQSFEGKKIILPRNTNYYPDKERLEIRYQQFLS